MAVKPHEDASNMKAILQPDVHPLTDHEIKEMNKQHGGKRTLFAGNSSVLPDSARNYRAGQGVGTLEDQNIETDTSPVFEEKRHRSTASSMSTGPVSDIENKMQMMTTRRYNTTDLRQISSSVNRPLQSQNMGSTKENLEGGVQVNPMVVKHFGSSGGLNQDWPSSFNYSSVPQNTSNDRGSLEESGSMSPTMKQSSSGRGFSQSIGDEQASPSCSTSYQSPQSPLFRNGRVGVTGPDNQMKSQLGAGCFSGQRSPSEFVQSPPSPRDTSYGSEGHGKTVPDKLKMNTQHDSKEGFGLDRPSVPSSPMSTGHYGDERHQMKGPERRDMKPSERCSDATQYTPPASKPQGYGSGTSEGANKKVSHDLKEGASSCCTNTDLKQIGQCQDDLGPLIPTKKHTVLVDSNAFTIDGRIVPFEGAHAWHPHFVKLPFVQNTTQGGLNQDLRWKQIKKQLNSLASKSTATVRDVAETIVSFNPKYKSQWSFESLYNFTKRLAREDNYVHDLFPNMAKLALRLPEEVKKAIPLLRAGHIAAITMSQKQIACLLANAFFCTFPHRNTSDPKAEYHNYPSINFSSLLGGRLERKNEKLRAIMHYFKVVTDPNANLNGLVTFERRVLRGADQPEWRSCTEKIKKLHISSDGTIETQGCGLLQVDFANSLIGGGVLGSGLVQEEILFLINPELIVSRLFTERLHDEECLIITGSQQFSYYGGYSDSFVWNGPCHETLKKDSWSRWQRQIVALDAVHYRSWKEQFRMDKINRELNKAYCGFKGRAKHNNPDIATGKWGCGAFNGDPQLKAIIQLMAAAKAGRGLAFFTFNDTQLEQDLRQIHHLLFTKSITVGKLYKLLQDYCYTLQRGHVGLFPFLWKAITSEPTNQRSPL